MVTHWTNNTCIFQIIDPSLVSAAAPCTSSACPMQSAPGTKTIHVQGTAAAAAEASTAKTACKHSAHCIRHGRVIDRCHCCACCPQGPDCDPEMYLRAHPPLRVLPDGRPCLLVSVVDHRVADSLTKSGRLGMQQALDDFMRVIGNVGGCCKGAAAAAAALFVGLGWGSPRSATQELWQQL